MQLKHSVSPSSHFSPVTHPEVGTGEWAGQSGRGLALGALGAAGTELGWDQICTRKKGKEIPSGCRQQGKAGRCWCCLAGEIICTERMQPKQIS